MFLDNCKVLLTFYSIFIGIVCSVQSDEIVLQSGDLIHGEITEQNDEFLTVKHPDLGTFQIPLGRIRSFAVAQPVTAEEATEVAKSAEGEIPESIWYMPEFKRLNNWAAKRKEEDWRMSIDLSTDGSWGNTNEQSLRFGSRLRREQEDKRMHMDLTYYNKTTDGDTTDNKLTTGFRRDWLNPTSRWFYFIETRYDFDEFESWRHRASGHGGPGYALVDTPRFQLDVLTGPGTKKEWGSENDDLYFEGIIGLDLEWKITRRQTLTAFTAYYPVLTDPGDYRMRSNLNWRFQLDQELKLSYLLGVEHEYIDIVDPGSKRNDTRVFMGIRYDF